jgi:hypothetical protein
MIGDEKYMKFLSLAALSSYPGYPYFEVAYTLLVQTNR